MALELPRRDFLRGLLAVAAPAIVSCANIMPVKLFSLDTAYLPTDELLVKAYERYSFGYTDTRVLDELRDFLLPGLRAQAYKQFPQIDWSSEFDLSG